jgi:hypothetical protein
VKTDAEVVREAAHIIRDNGFGKKQYYDRSTNCYCAAGAIRQAASERGREIYRSSDPHTWLTESEEVQVNQICYKADGLLSGQGRTPNIVAWNDEPGTTKEDVLEFLDVLAGALELEVGA